MAMGDEKRRRIVYDVLGMPDPSAGIPPGWVACGETVPADCQAIVERLTERRIRGIQKLMEIPGLPGEAHALLWRSQFHSYQDFLLAQRHANPTRKDGIAFGQSLARYPPDLNGYLAYLQTAAPTLHRFLFTPLPVVIPDWVRERHCEIVGATGSGKSVFINTDIHALRQAPQPPTILLIEPHGDLADDVARSRQIPGEDKVFLDPLLDHRFAFTVNPFDINLPRYIAEPRSDREHELVAIRRNRINLFTQSLLEVMSEMCAGNIELTRAMDTFIRPLLAALLDRRGDEPPATFLDLLRFLDDERNADLVERGRRSPYHVHAAFFAHQFYQKKWNSTKGALASRIQALLNMETFYNVIVGDGRSTIDIERLINSRRVIILRLHKDMGGDVVEAVGRFFLALFKQYAEIRPKEQRVPVHLYIDEFPRFAIDSIANALNEMRKFRLHYYLARQYRGQATSRTLEDAVRKGAKLKVFGLCAEPADEVLLANALGIEPADYKRVATGRFFLKADTMRPFLCRVPPDFAGDGFRLGEEAWEQLRAAQLQRYYRRLDARQAPREGAWEPAEAPPGDEPPPEVDEASGRPSSPPRRF